MRGAVGQWGSEAVGRHTSHTSHRSHGLSSPISRRHLRLTALLPLVCLAAACGDRTPFQRTPSAEAVSPEAIEHRILLIGDVGDDDGTDDEPSSRQPALLALRDVADEAPENTTVIFLGDLVYEHGIPADGRPAEVDRAQRRLLNEMTATGSAATVLVPGNHDWANGYAEGWDNIQALSDVARKYREQKNPKLIVSPPDACPGPVVTALGSHAELIAIDTQWWLHSFGKPNPKNNPSLCPQTTEDEILAALVARLREARAAGKIAIVAAHHPLRSYGAHGGFFDWQAQIFPLTMTIRSAWIPFPGVGSLVTFWRSYRSWMVQDLSHPSYMRMRETLAGVLAQTAAEGNGPLVYAAGHDHGLQLMHDDQTGIFHLISGQGSRYQVMHVTHGDDTVFSHAQADRPGFMEIDVLQDQRVQLTVHEVNADNATAAAVYRTWLSTPE